MADEFGDKTIEDGRKALQVLIPIVFGLFVVVFLFNVASVGSAGFLDRIVIEHPAATIGMPLCALAALCLVLLLRSTSGPIEFEAVGFKFKGAAGPIIMWILTFLAMVVALKLLW